MAKDRVQADAKAGGGQGQSRRKPGGSRKGQPKGQPAAVFSLQKTTVSTFMIGGGAVDVVLTGTGLDLEGLEVAILDPALDQAVPGDTVLIELPQKAVS